MSAASAANSEQRDAAGAARAAAVDHHRHQRARHQHGDHLDDGGALELGAAGGSEGDGGEGGAQGYGASGGTRENGPREGREMRASSGNAERRATKPPARVSSPRPDERQEKRERHVVRRRSPGRRARPSRGSPGRPPTSMAPGLPRVGRDACPGCFWSSARAALLRAVGGLGRTLAAELALGPPSGAVADRRADDLAAVAVLVAGRWAGCAARRRRSRSEYLPSSLPSCRAVADHGRPGRASAIAGQRQRHEGDDQCQEVWESSHSVDRPWGGARVRMPEGRRSTAAQASNAPTRPASRPQISVPRSVLR